ncbi:DUF6086 family protein [Streptomyces sp. NPDC057539]|uniref:DUF6086 family protein n=1 Tax=Streptomyces sp. NPDC057539 TaxID=3346159 RepID=UPI0036C22A58
MSYHFEVGGETLWDAGFRTGQLYAALTRGAAEFLKLPSGLTPNDQGGCDVEVESFQAFVEALDGMYSSTQNQVLHGLAHDLLLTSLVLLERAGGEITLTQRYAAALLEEKPARARLMG